MLVVMVHIAVKPEYIDAFKAASETNARNSAKEPGIARFDVVQDAEDPSRFILVEVYRTEEATRAHKETAHYKAWRDAVEPMMAAPRSSRRYRDICMAPPV